jgi:precorrin-2 dehydrogenase/sirohydrochlorin ferrochelatase
LTGKPYPIVLTNLQSTRCVVVGGGQVAERKVESLLECGAQVVVVSPTITERLQGWAAEGRLVHTARTFEAGDVDGALLVFAATNRREVNAAVAWAGREARALVNVADDPLAGDFHTAAAVRQGDLLLAVSTGGASPAVAALVRRKLLTMFGPEYAALLELLGALRPRVLHEVPPRERSRIWHSLATDEVLGWLRTGTGQRARAYAEELIARVSAAPDV